MTRRALCIGINNYPGTHMDLSGCVNDARAWASELEARQFNVKTLLDAEATKDRMVAAIKELIGAATGQDTVVITYSGHGTYVPDLNGDELDGLDEGLCPYDIQTAGKALIDDEIRTLFETRAAGVKLVLISDSCHSGTVTRAAAADPDVTDALRPRFLPMGNWLPEDQLPKGLNERALQGLLGASGSAFASALSRAGGDLLISGCKEGPNNYSYDATIQGRPTGAFTYYALKALKGLPQDATYAQWYAAITPRYLPSRSYPQTPQLVGSAAIRTQKIFT